MSVFQNLKDRFNLEPKNGIGMRKCQLGALWALKAYFVTNDSEVAALISMPTGSGKSAIMMAACFELNLKKILIIEPSKILRAQICEQFKSLDILKKIGCLDSGFPEVKVFEITCIQPAEKWIEIFSNYDVIVAHPNSISPYYKRVEPIPEEFIDAIFMDEAHHEASPTWKAINTYYSRVKRVFLTATPFRRDKKMMEAKLVYHYSLKKAFEDHILRPIDFHGVEAGLDEDASDIRLIQAAKKVFSLEIQSNPISLMIRTNRISHAKKLLEAYKSEGFKVDIIHSDREDKDNSKVIKEVKEGLLDGLISVGMASEGLDIPMLKIAVLHSTPRSIPYTIQFLGRISRQPIEQKGNAILIANIDEVTGEVKKLYKSDETWAKIIPKIIDEKMNRARYYRSALIDDPDFILPDLNIFFSAVIYDVSEDFSFNTDFKVKNTSPYKVSYVSQSDLNSPLIVVTVLNKPIDWANNKIYIDNYLDIHLLYHIPEKNLLFEFTTSEEALNSFVDSVYIGENEKISYSKLYKVLSKFKKENYLMVGMKNAVMPGTTHPSYKTFIGKSVQDTIRYSEGRVFGVGHALLKMGENKTWGIATKNSRVWAMKRGTVDEYQDWCNDLAVLLGSNGNSSTLPGLSFLASTAPVQKLEDLPISILPDDIFFKSEYLLISISGGLTYNNIVPNFEIRTYDQENGDLICNMNIESFECQLIMNFNNSKLWTVVSDNVITVRLFKDDNSSITNDLEKFINSYPPTLIMPKGYIIEGRTKITPNSSIENLPEDIWVKKDWEGCTITKEAYQKRPVSGAFSVINKSIEFIKPEFDINTDVLVLDDGAHEIADLIWIQGSKHIIHFIHCKPSKTIKPGNRKSDCDIVFTQAMRSVHWVYTDAVFERIRERMIGKSKIILGKQELFEDIVKSFGVNDWKYKIVVAQPGFKIDKVSNKKLSNNNVYELTIPTYERITAGLADFEIWGS